MTNTTLELNGYSRNEVWRGITWRRALNDLRLKHAATKSLGLLEKGILFLEGRSDGNHQLIKFDGDVWSTPFVKREADRLTEYCAKAWGTLQNDYTYLLAKSKYLIADIQKCEKRMEEIDFRIAETKDGRKLSERKRGEEYVSEAVVHARRTKELASELSPLNSERSALEEQILADFTDLNAICSALNEFRNTVKMICERVSAHTLQRLDYYWRTVLVFSPNNVDLPVSVTIDTASPYEEVFVQRHEELLIEVEALSTLIDSANNRKGE